jgi:hypothetical protein
MRACRSLSARRSPKQLRFLLANRAHPSLRAKKYNEALDV